MKTENKRGGFSIDDGDGDGDGDGDENVTFKMNSRFSSFVTFIPIR